MDQIKIGRFISERRKNINITQSELAEKLGITDRAISKWENGICLPDVGTMPELCNILDISINDLFSGEIVDMKDSEKKLEENLIEMTRLKEKKDKELLTLEIVIVVLVSLEMLVLIMLASFLEMPNSLRIVLILLGIIPFVIGVCFAIRIEQIAGYYECDKCHHKYIPTYNNVLFSMHINRTRYMSCPKCHKKSWQRKVIN